MRPASVPAYHHTMRGNVFFRAGRYEEARHRYALALSELRAMDEPRGRALARLGPVESLARLGRQAGATCADLDVLEVEFDRIGLTYARRAVAEFRGELLPAALA